MLANRRRAVQLVVHQHSCAGLYQAVILRAVQDLAQRQHRDEAREWLLSPESDCAFSAAGINPDSIRQQLI